MLNTLLHHPVVRQVLESADGAATRAASLARETAPELRGRANATLRSARGLFEEERSGSWLSKAGGLVGLLGAAAAARALQEKRRRDQREAQVTTVVAVALGVAAITGVALAVRRARQAPSEPVATTPTY